MKGLALGTLGEVEPAVVNAYGLTGRIGFLEVSLEALSEEPRRPLESRPVSRFPAGDVDLAFVLDETVPAGEVTETITRAGGDLLESCWLFDVYRSDQIGARKKSLAFRLRFRAPDRTLDDAELARLRQTAIDAVTKEHGAALRS